MPVSIGEDSWYWVANPRTIDFAAHAKAGSAHFFDKIGLFQILVDCRMTDNNEKRIHNDQDELLLIIRSFMRRMISDSASHDVKDLLVSKVLGIVLRDNADGILKEVREELDGHILMGKRVACVEHDQKETSTKRFKTN